MFNKVANVDIFHVKSNIFRLQNSYVFIFLQICKCVIWIIVAVLGKYLNYAFLIVSPDIWFYVVI